MGEEERGKGKEKDKGRRRRYRRSREETVFIVQIIQSKMHAFDRLLEGF